MVCVCVTQLFSPLETLDDDLLIDLIYAQIVSDVFSESLRILPDDVDNIKTLLSQFAYRVIASLIRRPIT